MRRGRLKSVVTIESPTDAKGTSFGRKQAWNPFLRDISAGIKHLSGNERRSTSHGGEAAEARTEFTLDYRPGITSLMRVSCNGVKYNIRHVNNLNEANRTLILTCDTGMNDG